MTVRPLSLIILDGEFAVCRLPHDASIPDWASAGQLFSITRTPDELSLVCRQSIVPAGISCERNWRCLRVAGSMPFTDIGVLASLAVPLADSRIGIFAISTFDTDYLFVKHDDFAQAIGALQGAGHHVDSGQIP